MSDRRDLRVADIAGFTALTEAHGDEEAANLVADFCGRIKAELPDSGGTHIKTIGDAILLRVPDPEQAVLLGLRITNDLMRGHGAPAIRVRLHHGPAVEREATTWCHAQPRRARVGSRHGRRGARHGPHGRAGAKPRGSSLRAARPAESQRPRAGGPVRRRPSRPTGGGNLPIDPVCHMAVDPEHAAGRLMFEGSAYFFCSLPCAAEFARRPERFAG